MDKNDIERLISPKELGEVLGLRRSKIHRMLRSGEIPSVIVAKGVKRSVLRVKPSVLAAWMQQREAGQHRGQR